MKGLAVFGNGTLLAIFPRSNPCYREAAEAARATIVDGGMSPHVVDVSFAPGIELENACRAFIAEMLGAGDASD